MHVSPITVDGTIVGSVAMVTDNTDLHLAAAEREEALRSAEDANAATMRLLSWVSHELRTPLNTISGFAQLLESSLATDDDRSMGLIVDEIVDIVEDRINVQLKAEQPGLMGSAIIGGKDAPGRQKIQATIDSLVQQSKDLVAAANAVGITRLTLVKP